MNFVEWFISYSAEHLFNLLLGVRLATEAKLEFFNVVYSSTGDMAKQYF